MHPRVTLPLHSQRTHPPAGVPAIILLPKAKVTREQLIQPIANGALTLSLETDFDGCMAIVQKLADRKDFYLANSINSIRIEGQKTISMEIVQQFDWEVPDWIIIPGGNLGNVSALGLGFLMMLELGIIDKLPRIACAQAETCKSALSELPNRIHGIPCHHSAIPHKRQQSRLAIPSQSTVRSEF